MPSLNARVYLFQGQDRVSRLSRVAFVDERYLILIAYALPCLASDTTSIFEVIVKAFPASWLGGRRERRKCCTVSTKLALCALALWGFSFYIVTEGAELCVVLYLGQNPKAHRHSAATSSDAFRSLCWCPDFRGPGNDPILPQNIHAMSSASRRAMVSMALMDGQGTTPEVALYFGFVFGTIFAILPAFFFQRQSTRTEKHKPPTTHIRSRTTTINLTRAKKQYNLGQIAQKASYPAVRQAE